MAGLHKQANGHGLTRDRLFDLLDYSAETGEFTWKFRVENKRGNGRIAGAIHPHGYRRICIDGNLHSAQRLAWLYVYGAWPTILVDHINGDRSDNRIANLRLADFKENQQNRRRSKSNTSGKTGVRWCKQTGKWRAYIEPDGKSIHLGRFQMFEDACRARAAAEAKYFTHANVEGVHHGSA